MKMKSYVIRKQKHVEQVKTLCGPDDKVIVRKGARIDVIDSLCCGILVIGKRAHVGRIHNAHLSAIILKKESVVGRLTGTSLSQIEEEHPIVYVGRGTIRDITGCRLDSLDLERGSLVTDVSMSWINVMSGSTVSTVADSRIKHLGGCTYVHRVDNSTIEHLSGDSVISSTNKCVIQSMSGCSRVARADNTLIRETTGRSQVTKLGIASRIAHMTGFSSVRSTTIGSKISVMDHFAAIDQSCGLIEVARGNARIGEIVRIGMGTPKVTTKSVNHTGTSARKWARKCLHEYQVNDSGKVRLYKTVDAATLQTIDSEGVWYTRGIISASPLGEEPGSMTVYPTVTDALLGSVHGHGGFLEGNPRLLIAEVEVDLDDIRPLTSECAEVTSLRVLRFMEKDGNDLSMSSESLWGSKVL